MGRMITHVNTRRLIIPYPHRIYVMAMSFVNSKLLPA